MLELVGVSKGSKRFRFSERNGSSGIDGCVSFVQVVAGLLLVVICCFKGLEDVSNPLIFLKI